MNTFQISCFLAVAEHLNFARAAEQLHVTQPAVTQQIHSLEKELGGSLFARTTRSVRLTQEGRLFLQDARQLFHLATRAKARFQNASTGGIQDLAVGCDSYPCLFSLSGVLGQLRQGHPNLHPHLQVVPFPQAFRLLEEGDLEVVVGFRKPGVVKGTTYRELATFPLVGLLPAGHPLATREVLRLEDLKGERLVLLPPERTLPQAAKLQGALLEGKPPEEVYLCDSGEAIAALVGGGFGVAILPNLLVPPSGTVEAVPLVGAEPASFGVYYRTHQGKPLVKAFIAALREEFAAPKAEGAGQAPGGPPCAPGGSGVQ